MNQIIEIHVTFPDEESAQATGRTLVEEKWVACVNVFHIQSLYLWQNKLIQEPEYSVLLKTISSRIDGLLHKINSLHPYDIPAITWHPIETTPEYRDWILETLGQ